MSGSDRGDSRPMDNSGEGVPPINIHPKLMTNRNSSSNPTSARQHAPRSARSDGTVTTRGAAPSNAELAEAGVLPQDGVVRQLSSRKQESGSLAAPRHLSGSTSGRRVPAAIAAGNGIGEPLQLSEAHQRRESNGTPRSQRQQQPTRHAPYATGTRFSAGASREPIGSVRNGGGGASPFRSPSKHNDPYGHVTSVVSEYRNNHISALEAQYRSVRSQSSAPVSQTRDPAEYCSESQPQQPQQQRRQQQNEIYSPRSARQESSKPRHTVVEYLRGGVPRAALDAPHIKYAEALENMSNCRYQLRGARAYTPSASTAPTAFLPHVAQAIPDRFKYVEPSDEEKKLRKAETLRLLQEWQDRQKAILPAHNRAASPQQQQQQEEQEEQQEQASRKTGARKRSNSKNRARTSSQQIPVERAPAAKSSAAAVAHKEEKPEWDSTFKPGFGTPPQSPRTGSKTPRSARSGWKGAGALRASSSRNGRKSRGATPPATARGEATVNPNAFRRRLLFEVTAPTLAIV